MICKGCYTPLPQGAQVCDICGQEPPSISCPYCQEKIPEGRKFCPNCRGRLEEKSQKEEKPCPNCGEFMASYRKRCKKCTSTRPETQPSSNSNRVPPTSLGKKSRNVNSKLETVIAKRSPSQKEDLSRENPDNIENIYSNKEENQSKRENQWKNYDHICPICEKELTQTLCEDCFPLRQSRQKKKSKVVRKESSSSKKNRFSPISLGIIGFISSISLIFLGKFYLFSTSDVEMEIVTPIFPQGENLAGLLPEATEEVLPEEPDTTTEDDSSVPKLYHPVLQSYGYGLEFSWSEEEYASYDLNPIMNQYNFTNVGYISLDLDGNGVKELIVGSMEHQGNIIDLYTIYDEERVLLLRSEMANPYILCDDHLIVHSRDGIQSETLELQGNQLISLEDERKKDYFQLDNPCDLGLTPLAEYYLAHYN